MSIILPDEFRESHDLAIDLHNRLAQVVIQGEAQDIFFASFPLDDPEEIKEFKERQGEEVWQWLEITGRRDVLNEYICRHTTVAVLADFCQFIYEGLMASEKGKHSVAFTLFRKPIRDNLFLLEWLLADREDFLSHFRRGPQAIDMSQMTKERRLSIIGAAMDNSLLSRWIEPDYFHQLRFDKDAPHGFDWICNQAIHIVTTRKQYATEVENLNFVFSQDEDRWNYWDYIYRSLPVILFHAVQVVESLIAIFAPNFEDEHPLDGDRRVLRFLQWIDGTAEADEENLNCSEGTMGGLLAAYELSCPECQNDFDCERQSVTAFAHHGILKCKNCGLLIYTDDSKPEEEQNNENPA